MNRTDFRRLFAYSDNCWRLLGETLATCPDVWEKPFETTSHWNTVRLLLAHTIGAEERWITLRLQNLPLPVIYEQRAALEWSGLYRDHQTVRAATYAYVERLTSAELEEEKSVEMGQGEYRVRLTRADMLFHILNHENYHRGQVITALQRFGVDPPNFDYVLLKENARPIDGG
jgi:uncharacterized damage-inducible protein DinB